VRTLHIDSTRQVFGDGRHAVRAAVTGMPIAVSETSAPFAGNICLQPLIHDPEKVVASSSEKLCPVVEDRLANSTSCTAAAG
jgi:hypothetical protein